MNQLLLKKIKRNRGFSIIELMVVISIISIVSGICIPNIIRWRQDHQLNSATRSIQSVIQKMRLQALKEKSSTEVEFHVLTNEYETRTYIRGIAGGKVKVAKYKLPPGIKIQRITFRDNTLKFNSRGLTSGGMGTVSLCNECGTTRRIVVPITGNSRIAL